MSLARDLTLGPRRRPTAKMRPVFYQLHALTLAPATTTEQLTAAIHACEDMPERRRVSEGAVYTTALRRYHMLTGTPYTR